MTQLDQTHPSNSSEDITVDMKELVGLLWGGRKLIILVTSVVSLCTVFYALSLTDHYRSNAVMSLMTEDKTTAIAGGVSGLVSIAGLNLASEYTKGAMIVNTISSRQFLKHLLSFDDVLPSLMAAKSYDSETKKLVFDPDIYDATNKKWLQATPSYLAVYDVYMKQLTVTYDANLGLIRLHTEHISPIFAKEFLDLIIREADKSIRDRDVKRANEALAYLTSEISKTSLVAMKSSMNQLIQSQLETHMMAKISSSYILQVIEPPFIPEIKFKPSRSLIFILGTGFGFVIGILLILIRYYFDLTGISMPSGVTDKGALIVKTIRNKIKLIKISFPKRIQ